MRVNVPPYFGFSALAAVLDAGVGVSAGAGVGVTGVGAGVTGVGPAVGAALGPQEASKSTVTIRRLTINQIPFFDTVPTSLSCFLSLCKS